MPIQRASQVGARPRARDPEAGLNITDPDPRPETRQVDLLARQEITRAILTIVAAGIFVVTLVGAFILANSDRWNNAKELLQIFLPVEGTLLGGAGGFYFATKK